nr:hypothetical protein [Tanacetum cinerariifolium]
MSSGVIGERVIVMSMGSFFCVGGGGGTLGGGEIGLESTSYFLMNFLCLIEQSSLLLKKKTVDLLRGRGMLYVWLVRQTKESSSYVSKQAHDEAAPDIIGVFMVYLEWMMGSTRVIEVFYFECGLNTKSSWLRFFGSCLAKDNVYTADMDEVVK